MQTLDKAMLRLRPWQARIHAFRPAWIERFRARERLVTAVSRTVDGIEWTVLRIKTDGTEDLRTNMLPLGDAEPTAGENIESLHFPENLAERLSGDIVVSLRSSELLMRVMEFPSSDPSELESMVLFQMDKVSPYPADQIAVSHEILKITPTGSLVLMAAARRRSIDAIGDAFEAKGVRIHSIDARILGWLRLISDAGRIPSEGGAVLVVDDGIDFLLVVADGGIPVSFRTIHRSEDAGAVAEELAYELTFMLASLDAERGIAPFSGDLYYWGFWDPGAEMCSLLGEKTGLRVSFSSLVDLPPLSEGVIRRAKLPKGNRIELIPMEWIEHVHRQRLRRRATIASGSVAAIWFVVMLLLVATYEIRAVALARVQSQAAAIASEAKTALENRQKLKALKVYANRSASALECLREATRMLPAGDIQFSSFKYNKGKGVKLDGTAAVDNIVYDYFGTLSTSTLFKQLTEQRVEARTTKTGRRTIYSVNLVLPAEGDAE